MPRPPPLQPPPAAGSSPSHPCSAPRGPSVAVADTALGTIPATGTLSRKKKFTPRHSPEPEPSPRANSSRCRVSSSAQATENDDEICPVPPRELSTRAQRPVVTASRRRCARHAAADGEGSHPSSQFRSKTLSTKSEFDISFELQLDEGEDDDVDEEVLVGSDGHNVPKASASSGPYSAAGGRGAPCKMNSILKGDGFAVGNISLEESLLHASDTSRGWPEHYWPIHRHSLRVAPLPL
ncbi:hypothetical protein FGB62_72g022 [Gracilaria domingensis]|nr:hypothetical protein FGB62_72g022 [Gracilaria domingensis]